MLRARSVVFVLLAIAVPATAQTFAFSTGTPADVCPFIGDASYRIAAPGERADYRVRIDPAAAAPAIRVQLSATIDDADFVLVDAGDRAADCSGARRVRLDAAAADLTVGIASPSEPADYRIYVRSRSLSPEAAAALYAAARWSARGLARANDSN